MYNKMGYDYASLSPKPSVNLANLEIKEDPTAYQIEGDKIPMGRI